MNISYNWLQNYLQTSLKAAELSAILTNTGLEVESLDSWSTIPGGLQGLIVGEVTDVKKHPDADRLNLTQVNTGTGTLLQIVCGAPNVAAGQKVIIAPVGSMVHPLKGEPFQITRSKIRGLWSEGMICAEDEISLGESHDGILVLDASAVPGELLTAHLKISADEVFEIGITPNRSDALSHKGVARDVLAYLHAHHPLKGTSGSPAPASGTEKSDDNSTEPSYSLENIDQAGARPLLDAAASKPAVINILIESPEDCIRFSGITISGVTIKPSPDWLQNSLRAIGLRPVNNVVDITNYICHDLGQPMHAYDLREIKGGKIIASRPASVQPFTTLDGVVRSIQPSDLMISDAEGPLGVAGVFGGLNSGIKADTTSVFLESACFNPVSVRKTARRLGLKTDASFRFERGTDPGMTLDALEKACKLVLECAGGEISSHLQDIYPTVVNPVKVQLRRRKLDSLIGSAIPSVQVTAILGGLGIQVISHLVAHAPFSGIEPAGAEQLRIAQETEVWNLEIPLFKVDVTREADVIEEVLRIYGFNEIAAPEQLRSSLPFTLKSDPEQIRETAANWLSALGFNEIMTNSLSSSQYIALAGPELEAETVHVLNPLSMDLDVMRQTLLYSGLKAVAYNHNRKIENLRYYEFGKTYHKIAGKYEERNHLALFLSGNDLAESWLVKSKPVNVFHIKGYVDGLLNRMDVQAVSHTVEEHAWLRDAISWDRKKTTLVTAGLVSPALLKNFGIQTDVWFVSFSWDELLKLRRDEKLLTKAIPRFPAVRRDLSLLLTRDLEFSKLRSIAMQAGISILKEASVFDVYEGDKIEKGMKSYAMSFMLESADHTLTDQEIDEAMTRLIKQLGEKSGAQVRNK